MKNMVKNWSMNLVCINPILDYWYHIVLKLPPSTPSTAGSEYHRKKNSFGFILF